MLNFPGIVLGTWVLNNLTYPFFLLSKDLLYRTWLSQLFYLILLRFNLEGQAQGLKSPFSASEASLVLCPPFHPMLL